MNFYSLYDRDAVEPAIKVRHLPGNIEEASVRALCGVLDPVSIRLLRESDEMCAIIVLRDMRDVSTACASLGTRVVKGNHIEVTPYELMDTGLCTGVQ